MTCPGGGRCPLTRLNSRADFFPCAFSHSSRGKEAPAWLSFADRFGPLGAAVQRPLPSVAIEAAIGAAQQRRSLMATIGTFQKQADGAYTGSITTLTANPSCLLGLLAFWRGHPPTNPQNKKMALRG